MPSDADIVFFPTQKPGTAQAFASSSSSRARRRRSSAATARTGSASSRRPARTSRHFAPIDHGFASDKAIIAGWKKDNKGKPVGSFGPPTYGAVQVILQAIKAACTKGNGTIAKRALVIGQMRKVHIDKGWILGGKFAWSKVNTHDPNVTKFYIMQIQSNGSYKLMN